MKKLLRNVLILTFLSTSAFAEITIWCKGDYEEGWINGEKFKDQLNTNYLEVRINNSFIEFVNDGTKPTLPRNENDGNLKYSAFNIDSKKDLYRITIDRATGVLDYWRIKKGFYSHQYYNCTANKPKVKF